MEGTRGCNRLEVWGKSAPFFPIEKRNWQELLGGADDLGIDKTDALLAAVFYDIVAGRAAGCGSP